MEEMIHNLFPGFEPELLKEIMEHCRMKRNKGR